MRTSFDYIVPGTTINEATGGSSNSLAIPNGADGNKARYVGITIGTAAAYFLFGASGDSVTSTTGIVINPGDGMFIFATKSHTHIHHLQVASAGVISMTAIDGP